ncbi:hypothetical protein ACFX13_012923 [Malus domestica]|uniref:Non-haem dioxygenase N-terminal domain-containing protein n=1 Tax=Malus domestica TaxID=3750 RepID=A0A498I800_MALDO|nr:hypothetical protein DVH24_001822 [Malus domestica]
MVATNTNYYRKSEVKGLDDTKGVKGLVDAGITEVPRIFHQPPESDDHYSIKNSSSDSEASHNLTLIFSNNENVAKVREASETWGFFQIVNHGIPVDVQEEIKDGVRGFFDLDTQVKKELYSRDHSRPMVYNSNFDLYSSPATNWRDTVFVLYGS